MIMKVTHYHFLDLESLFFAKLFKLSYIGLGASMNVVFIS